MTKNAKDLILRLRNEIAELKASGMTDRQVYDALKEKYPDRSIAYKKNPFGLSREYYFNDGVREQSFTTERAAHSAALKLANRTGKSVTVKYRDATGSRRVGTQRMRRNPVKVYKGKYPNNIESVWGSKGEYQARTNSGSLYEVHVVGGKLPDLRTDINDWPRKIYLGQSTKRTAPSQYRRNPDAGMYVDLHNHYRALGEPQSKAILLGLAKKIRAKEAPPKVVRGATEYYTVTVIHKPTGRQVATETFATKRGANSFANSAREHGLSANVY